MRGRSLRCGVAAWLVGCVVISALLVVQGWKGRLGQPDRWMAVEAASELLERGALPDHGGVSSLCNFNPPGQAWLMTAGVALFRDQRLYEYPGGLLLHAGAILGVFVFANRLFGMRPALFASGAYAVSSIGLSSAGELWPRGHPCFSVWFFVSLHAWVRTRRSRFLALAMITWATGCYYLLELLPLGLAVPLLAWRQRLRIAPAAVVASLVVSGVLWAPYLRFEHRAGYADLLTVLSRQSICDVRPGPDQDRLAPCVAPMNVARKWEELPLRPLFARAGGALVGLLSTFIRNTSVPGGGGLLLMLCFLGLISILAPSRVGTRLFRGERILFGSFFGIGVLVCLATRLSSLGIIPFQMSAQATSSLYRLGAEAGCAGAFLLAWTVIRRHALKPGQPTATSLSRDGVGRSLVLAIVLCWAVFAVLIGTEDSRRLWWVWPLQLPFVAAAFVMMRRRWALAVATTAGVALLLNAPLTDRVSDWRAHGYAGQTPEVMRLMDRIASAAQTGGSVSVRYDISYPGWFLAAQRRDPRYRPGTDLDWYLRTRYGIANAPAARGGHERWLLLERVLTTDRKFASCYGPDSLAGYELLDRTDRFSLYQLTGG